MKILVTSLLEIMSTVTAVAKEENSSDRDVVLSAQSLNTMGKRCEWRGDFKESMN